MKLKKLLFSTFMTCSLFFTSCSNLSLPSNANTAFENFTLQLFQQEVASTTLNLHYTLQNPEVYGISSSTVTLGTFQTDATPLLSSLENYQTALDKFSYNALSKENQLTYDILTYYIDTETLGASYLLYKEPLSPLTGIHAQLPVLLAEYAFHSVDDVETYLALLETTPLYFSSLIEFEREKAKAGLFMSDDCVDAVLEQCNAFLSIKEQHYLLSTFSERLSNLPQLSETLQNKYLIQNEQALSSYVFPAYENLVSSLTNLKGSGKNELGLYYYPDGKDYYTYLISSESGSSRSINEILTLIEKQITSDFLDMQHVLSENPSLLEAQSPLVLSSPDLILDELKEKITTTFPKSSPVDIEIKYVPSVLEEYLSPAFYLIPTIDNTAPNVIYINKSHLPDDIHLFTTLAHEGYPGHLYQTTYFSSTNPNPLRMLLNFKGYVEGWATYAEMCSYYLSSYENTYATLLQKNNSLILGLYASADIGIHYQGWDLERTQAFFHTYGIDDNEVIREIFELIIGDPANYLTYYLGYLEILELKQEIILEKGENFSQLDFHKKLLKIGPAPFDIISKRLLGDAS